MKRVPLASILLTLLLAGGLPLRAADGADRQPGDLEQIQAAENPLLSGVTSVAISQDGKFLYAAAFHNGIVTTFARNPETGEIQLQDSVTAVTDPMLQAAVAIRLSRDGGYAVVSAFAANAITVFKRDKETGKLTMLDSAREAVDGKEGLNFVVDASFSSDNHYIYTASAEGVGVYRMENEKLSFVQLERADGQLRGVRGVALSPDGKAIYAAGQGSGTVAVLRPDLVAGPLKLIQVLADGENGCEGLAGAFRVGCSPDGNHVYVSSGRFGGDQAVSAFAVQPDGTLQLVEQHLGDDSEMEGFKGGNDINVSPDGRLVFALATVSDRLFRFQRDTNTGALISIGSQQVGVKEVPGSAGLCFSPDNRYVYIADEDSSSIVVLKLP